MKYLSDNQKITRKALEDFNGRDGKPAYVAYKGKVYDVTISTQWIDGDHLGHLAGQDLTAEMEIAPHSEEVMERMKVVGVLAEE